MRRLYESRALEYDDTDPHAPKRRDEDDDPGPRSINWDAASHAILPRRLRQHAITVDVETTRDRYARDAPVEFRVTFRNRLPFPVTIPTSSPVPWTWSLDGLDEASHVASHPSDASLFEFSRAERKRFSRRWTQRVRQDARTWTPAETGEHTLGVRINTPEGWDDALAAETTFYIE